MFGRIKSIWALMEGQRLRYCAAIVAIAIASGFLYLAPLVPQIVIDGVLFRSENANGESQSSDFVNWAVELLGGAEYIRTHLWLPCVLIIGLTVVAGIFTYLRGRWSAKASETIACNVRDKAYDQLQRLPLKYHDSAETGDLIQRCTSDVETLRLFLSTQVVEIGRAIIMLSIPIPLMWAIDVRMTLMSLVLIPPIVVFSLVFFLKVKTAFKDTDEAEGKLTTTVQENLTGIRVVRAFARQEYECEKFDERNTTHRNADYRLYLLMAWYWASSDLLCFAQKAIVVFAGAYWLAVGELQVGAFFYFITVVSMFIWPVRMMGRILTDLGKAMVALGRLQDILDEDTESAPVNPADTNAITGDIIFDGVTFGHGNEGSVLHDVSFKAEPGETVALLGPSGCGKTTIVNLLLRLYDYKTGSIRLDEIELSDLDRQFVRGQMAVVMQEPFLYSKTLRDNLIIGRSSAEEDEMVEATSIACVHESIQEFEDRYETMIGERGVTLSGGQRQRVALARALLQNPAVLILDDALSAVDTATESMILDALKQRHGKQTTIVIAHRLSTLMHADQIIVLDHGRIVQHGNHSSLITKDGLYRRLWEIQTAIPKLDESQELSAVHDQNDLTDETHHSCDEII